MTGPGVGLLDVVRSPARSLVRRAYATSPLRFLTPRAFGDAAWIYTASYGGGLVGGDAIRLGLSVGARAKAFVSTQASTKVYRSDRPTSVDVHADVAENGLLIIWPDPVVCFAASTYRQTQVIDLAPDASVVVVDAMTSGRRQSGERWQFTRYETRTTVRCDGRMVLVDALALSGDEGDLATRMGRFDVLCTASIIGPALRADVEQVLMRAASIEVERRANILVAAAPLSHAAGRMPPGGNRDTAASMPPGCEEAAREDRDTAARMPPGREEAAREDRDTAARMPPGREMAAREDKLGCILRIAGRSVEDVSCVLRDYLSFVSRVLGDDPWARKW